MPRKSKRWSGKTPEEYDLRKQWTSFVGAMIEHEAKHGAFSVLRAIIPQYEMNQIIRADAHERFTRNHRNLRIVADDFPDISERHIDLLIQAVCGLPRHTAVIPRAWLTAKKRKALAAFVAAMGPEKPNSTI